jgi:hypothetical protein
MSPLAQIKRTVITGSKWAHREVIKSRNLGINQARSGRSSANAAAAIKTPDAAADIFLGQLLSTDPMNRFYPSRNDRASGGSHRSAESLLIINERHLGPRLDYS